MPYSAFGSVIADNQYSSLGLMLMANLASLNRIIAPFQEPATEEADVESTAVGHAKSHDMLHSHREDLGEAVARPTVTGEEDEVAKPRVLARSDDEKVSKAKRARRVPEESAAEVPSAKAAKKKRKKGNAIDDLFSGLF